MWTEFSGPLPAPPCGGGGGEPPPSGRTRPRQHTPGVPPHEDPGTRRRPDSGRRRGRGRWGQGCRGAAAAATAAAALKDRGGRPRPQHRTVAPLVDLDSASFVPLPHPPRENENGERPQDHREQEQASPRGGWIQPGPLLHQRAHHRHGVPGRVCRVALQELAGRGEKILLTSSFIAMELKVAHFLEGVSIS